MRTENSVESRIAMVLGDVKMAKAMLAQMDEVYHPLVLNMEGKEIFEMAGDYRIQVDSED